MRQTHLCIILLTLFSFSSFAERVSFEKNWKGIRSQGLLGTCHVFSAVALLEAEWASEFGETKDFAEADVSARHIFGQNDAQALDVFHNILSAQAPEAFLKNRYGGWVHTSFELAREHGLMEEEAFPYSKFASDIFAFQWHLSKDSRREKNGKFYDSFQQKLDEWFTRPIPQSKDWAQKLNYSRLNLALFSQQQLLDLLKVKIQCRPVSLEVSAKIWRREGSHAVVVAGYDPVKKTFLVRNSWGRAGILNKHERIREELIRDNIISLGFVSNPSQECLEKD